MHPAFTFPEYRSIFHYFCIISAILILIQIECHLLLRACLQPPKKTQKEKAFIFTIVRLFPHIPVHLLSLELTFVLFFWFSEPPAYRKFGEDEVLYQLVLRLAVYRRQLTPVGLADARGHPDVKEVTIDDHEETLPCMHAA